LVVSKRICRRFKKADRIFWLDCRNIQQRPSRHATEQRKFGMCGAKNIEYQSKERIIRENSSSVPEPD
jgi:hypothetical protein